MLTIYGIKNCDTMKKTFDWFTEAGIAYAFHDYKKQGIDAATLSRLEKALGWETLLNRRGTTWRKLPADVQAGINRENALLLMQEQPSLIKRPIIEKGKLLLAGYTPEQWASLK